MTPNQELIIKRANFKQNLINTVNKSELSPYDVCNILDDIFKEVAALAAREEEEAIAAYNEQMKNLGQEEEVVEEDLINDAEVVE